MKSEKYAKKRIFTKARILWHSILNIHIYFTKWGNKIERGIFFMKMEGKMIESKY